MLSIGVYNGGGVWLTGTVLVLRFFSCCLDISVKFQSECGVSVNPVAYAGYQFSWIVFTTIESVLSTRMPLVLYGRLVSVMTICGRPQTTFPDSELRAWTSSARRRCPICGTNGPRLSYPCRASRNGIRIMYLENNWIFPISSVRHIILRWFRTLFIIPGFILYTGLLINK